MEEAHSLIKDLEERNYGEKLKISREKDSKEPEKGDKQAERKKKETRERKTDK
jgi:hypothetical protein